MGYSILEVLILILYPQWTFRSHNVPKLSLQQSLIKHRVIIEVPKGVVLLEYLDEKSIWLKNLVDLLEKNRADNHSDVSLVNDVLNCKFRVCF